MCGINGLVAKLGNVASLYREIKWVNFSDNSWHSWLSKESQKRLRQYGRRLPGLISKYISESRRREETIKRAHNIGCDFGEKLAKQGFSLTDSLEALILHRDSVVNAATCLLKRREALSERTV